jgi:hypothetical protein
MSVFTSKCQFPGVNSLSKASSIAEGSKPSSMGNVRTGRMVPRGREFSETAVEDVNEEGSCGGMLACSTAPWWLDSSSRIEDFGLLALKRRR